MAISDKTRKTLWARACNRCALCRIELVSDKNEHDRNLNIGDECHIISEKENGPRHDKNLTEYDEYDNLILLCKNHHRTIDELHETYTVEILKTIKKNHEYWVSHILEKARSGEKSRGRFIYRITSGKELVDIINEVGAYQFDHDELKTQEEVTTIGCFLQNLKDWGDITGMGAIEHTQLIQLGFDLNREIHEIENLGFLIFGERSNKKMTNSAKDDLGTWAVATVLVIRGNNEAIIDMSKIVAQFT